MNSLNQLNNCIFHALRSQHRQLALSNGLAMRYPAVVAPFVGLSELAPAAFADLAPLVGPGEGIALLTAEQPEISSEWLIVRARQIDQMIYDNSAPPEAVPVAAGEFQALGATDVPEMLALAAATEPGPFHERTITTGRYFGIRSPAGALLAMAGERIRLDGFTEISAVCTAPQARGRGFGRILVSNLVSMIVGEGRQPFLHVKTENGARFLYEKLGFRVRAPILLTVLARPN